jgi:putative tryptophan/tyrosine transport system ATP-binding protein
MLELKSISKTFNAASPHEVKALQGLSFSVKGGEFVILLGTNGSGKSSLMNAIAGSFIVDRGSMHLDGKEITFLPEHARAPFIGRVFQNPFSGTASSMSLAENIALSAHRGSRAGLAWALDRTLLREMRERLHILGLGLENRLHESIGDLSGGERQALTLLMATWVKPRLLLLDEHTAALDPQMADLIITLSRKIIGQEKLTTLMVTHSMEQAAELGERIVMMHRGQVIHDFGADQKNKLNACDLRDLFDEAHRSFPPAL